MLRDGLGKIDAEPGHGGRKCRACQARSEQPLCGVGCGAKADVHTLVAAWRRGAAEA